MSVDPNAVRPAEPPCILIVDDDRRVVELLEIAFNTHGFRVVSAADGDEALRRVSADQPDLVVLDVRLPKRSGLEVCEVLRRDPREPGIPVILVSANAETETRLQAFRRGADDYLTKPFSPKELVARVRRLLARAAEAAQSRDRQRELERDLARARDELRRAHTDRRREQRLREMAFGFGGDLQRTLDPDELARRLLDAVCLRFGVGMAGLLVPVPPGGALEPLTVRGDGLERLAPLVLPRDGALVTLVSALARPVGRHELEALRDLRDELPPLVACGVTLLSPLRGAEGLEGLLVADERLDGRALEPAESEMLGGLCELAATSLRNALAARAQADASLDLLAAGVRGDHGAARGEAWSLVERAAHATLLPPRQRALLAHAVRLGTWGATPEGEAAIERLAAPGFAGYVEDLSRLIRRAHGLEPAAEAAPAEARAARLLAVALDYAEDLGVGGAPAAALARAVQHTPLDPTTQQALEAALAEGYTH